MPTYRILHVEAIPEGAEPRTSVVQNASLAMSAREAVKRAIYDHPVPAGWNTTAVEWPLSVLLTRWKDAGDGPFSGREDDLDALVMSAEEETDEGRMRETMLALADLADECGAFPALASATRSACV